MGCLREPGTACHRSGSGGWKITIIIRAPCNTPWHVRLDLKADSTGREPVMIAEDGKELCIQKHGTSDVPAVDHDRTDSTNAESKEAIEATNRDELLAGSS